VGLCSYLLIGFWFTKQSASDAGKKAFVVNRIGDFGFLLGMFVVWSQFGSLDFQESRGRPASCPPKRRSARFSLATLLLFVGATGKSAQIPLHVWLPDAMEGPTPVSALIHAATMVTAGVYMIGRNAVLFSHAPETLAIVARHRRGDGAQWPATIGLEQNDIKRILAYSTVSQLGLMFRGHGRGRVRGRASSTLYTHAFFKALLFLGSGAVIHALAGETGHQADGRPEERSARSRTGRSWVGSLAIAGVPFLSGFFQQGRDPLEEATPAGNTLVWGVAVAASLLTAIYMFPARFLDIPWRAQEHRPRRSVLEPRVFRPGETGCPRRTTPRRASGDGNRLLVLLAVGSVLRRVTRACPAVLAAATTSSTFSSRASRCPAAPMSRRRYLKKAGRQP